MPLRWSNKKVAERRLTLTYVIRSPNVKGRVEAVFSTWS